MAESMLIVAVVVFNAAFSGYGAWQLVHRWQLGRRGKDEKRLVPAGAAQLLLSSCLWVVVFLYSTWSHRFGPMTGRIAFGVCVALALLAVVADQRRKQPLTRANSEAP